MWKEAAEKIITKVAKVKRQLAIITERTSQDGPRTEPSVRKKVQEVTKKLVHKPRALNQHQGPHQRQPQELSILKILGKELAHLRVKRV